MEIKRTPVPPGHTAKADIGGCSATAAKCQERTLAAVDAKLSVSRADFPAIAPIPLHVWKSNPDHGRYCADYQRSLHGNVGWDVIALT